MVRNIHIPIANRFHFGDWQIIQNTAKSLHFSLFYCEATRNGRPKLQKNQIEAIRYGKWNQIASEFGFIFPYRIVERNCVLTMGRNVVWTTKARSGQSYNTKCV